MVIGIQTSGRSRSRLAKIASPCPWWSNSMRTLACLTVLALTAAAPAGDWPQWLGPHRDGTTAETVKPSTEPPTVVWRRPVGDGHSSPVVAAGCVCLQYQEPGKDAETLAVMDAATGAHKLGTTVDGVHFTSMFGGGPRATPAIAPDGQVVSFGVVGTLRGL